MKKIYLFFLLQFFLFSGYLMSQQKELILNTTGYGFSRTAPNGLAQWDYIQKFANLTYNGQDASVTAIRLYVDWIDYEPSHQNYERAKFLQAIQTLVGLKNGTMKIALHFPFTTSHNFINENNGYLTPSDMARTENGTISGDHWVACPSIYNAHARNKFYAFVADALDQISAYYNKILYIQVGNSPSEEFAQPWMREPDGYRYIAIHDSHALQAWRTEYLPCRYPGQSTVVWDGVTRTIASAPPAAQGQWPNWSSDHGKEFHRFASWGLMRFYKGFRDVVKSKSQNLKVLYYVSDFGSSQGNTEFLHNASLPMALQEFDGIYTTEGGGGPDQLYTKVMSLDVIKGTNPGKIACVEFDQDDLGQQMPPPPNAPLNVGVANEWFPRFYKHGADYIHLAMFFNDVQIEQLKPVFATLKTTYLNGSYQSPSRASSVDANVFPNVLTGTHLFRSTWEGLGGNNYSVSDVTPKSVRMIDDGYWQNVWSCTPSNPCDFNITASASNSNPSAGASVTLNSSCSGSNCSGLTYAWSGNGISGSNTSVTFNAPNTAGTYTYTITASKSGCSNKTATTTITTGSGGSNPCGLTDKQTVGTWIANNFVLQTRQYTVNGMVKWLIVSVVPGTTTDKHFPRGDNFVETTPINWTNGSISKSCFGGGETSWGGLTIPGGIAVPAGYTQGTEQDGAVYFQQSCSPPSAPSLSASPATITSGSSSSLSASGCSGGTITWSDGLGTGTSKSVSPASTKTYTATCTVGGCTSGNASVTVTVNPPSGGTNCNTLSGNVDGANCSWIEGWIYDSSNPNGAVSIDIYEGSTLIAGNLSANKFRQDLLNAGHGNGAHGFELQTPTELKDGQSHTLTFKVVGCSSYQFSNSPRTVNGCSNNMVVDPSADPAASSARTLSVYPNPNKGVFELNFYVEKGKKATILINDLQGRTLHKQVVAGQGLHKERISLSNKASGMLLVRIIKDQITELQKINIAR